MDSSLNSLLAPVLADHPPAPGALLPLLHALQERAGHVPPEAVQAIAEHLNLSRAEVHGVISYYHFFRKAPAGRTVLQICRAEACQARGAESLLAHAEQRLACASHSTRADGAVTVEPVYCLGLCASSPALMLNDSVHARMNAAKLDALLEKEGL
ncbi:formate dehydrogenase subunit gamma [Pelomonas sp. V22]|uniref:formate dehydrogenase subunit gamma n=1 Tax=Pelomonas sp. V22 TaxID=2822139 RepID=UPI0024A8C9CD|nr:formate dehydrogenase subunit gamma [Pelomonas sp. V22]MDI4634263.1 formate dehydrogenase subunit gamma [Pelomonas sp. V22]